MKLWDILELRLRPQEAMPCGYQFFREQLREGYNLTRVSHLPFDPMPQIEVVELSDRHITLSCGYEDEEERQRITFDESHPDCELRIGTRDRQAVLIIALLYLTLRIEEWDEYAQCERTFMVDEEVWEDARAGDPVAAQNIADTIASQAPEALEIIAKHMEYAWQCGSEDARDWLDDYYNGGDGRYDAYV